MTTSLPDEQIIRTRIIVAPVHPAAHDHMVSLIRQLNPEAEVITLAASTGRVERAPLPDSAEPLAAAGPSMDGADAGPARPAAETSGAGDGMARLSTRQREVLRHIVAGWTNKEIARHLNISPSTVRVHVSALLRVLNVPTRTAAAAFAAGRALP